MKILYGVQGTGNGHTTRARVMAKAFSETDIEVDWVFSGRAKHTYFDMEPFANYRTFDGLTFVVRKGKVDFVRTALGNNLFKFWRDVKSLDVTGYDLVIVDFEPVTAWAALRAGVKTVGLSHQCAFAYDVPKKNNNIITDTVMRVFAPVRKPIGLHWHHFNAPILPPIIDTEHLTRAAHVEQERAFLFYHPFMDLEVKLALLEPLQEKFYVYHGVPEPIDKGHIQVLPYSRDGFQEHLAACEGVITSAGFELSSEAIHLGKKLLVTPLKGQMEQFSNAAALRRLGFATVEEELTPEAIARWVRLPRPAASPFPDVARALVHWLQRWLREGAAQEGTAENSASYGSTESNSAALDVEALARELWRPLADATVVSKPQLQQG